MSTTLNCSGGGRHSQRKCPETDPPIWNTPKSRITEGRLRKEPTISPFTEKSQELIRSMGNTEYFEMCEITSKIQCQDCSRYWEIGKENCTCGTCLRPSQNNRKLHKDRFDVLSIPNNVVKKRLSHGARHGPTERQRIYFIDLIAVMKAQRKNTNSYWIDLGDANCIEIHKPI